VSVSHPRPTGCLRECAVRWRPQFQLPLLSAKGKAMAKGKIIITTTITKKIPPRGGPSQISNRMGRNTHAKRMTKAGAASVCSQSGERLIGKHIPRGLFDSASDRVAADRVRFRETIVTGRGGRLQSRRQDQQNRAARRQATDGDTVCDKDDRRRRPSPEQQLEAWPPKTWMPGITLTIKYSKNTTSLYRTQQLHDTTTSS